MGSHGIVYNIFRKFQNLVFTSPNRREFSAVSIFVVLLAVIRALVSAVATFVVLVAGVVYL